DGFPEPGDGRDHPYRRCGRGSLHAYRCPWPHRGAGNDQRSRTPVDRDRATCCRQLPLAHAERERGRGTSGDQALIGGTYDRKKAFASGGGFFHWPNFIAMGTIEGKLVDIPARRIFPASIAIE